MTARRLTGALAGVIGAISLWAAPGLAQDVQEAASPAADEAATRDRVEFAAGVSIVPDTVDIGGALHLGYAHGWRWRDSWAPTTSWNYVQWLLGADLRLTNAGVTSTGALSLSAGLSWAGGHSAPEASFVIRAGLAMLEDRAGAQPRGLLFGLHLAVVTRIGFRVDGRTAITFGGEASVNIAADYVQFQVAPEISYLTEWW